MSWVETGFRRLLVSPGLVLLLLVLGGLPQDSQAQQGTIQLRLVTGGPDVEGLQAQLPVWAPGATPQLVHEVSDRSRRTWLRTARVEQGGVPTQVIPAARSSRLAALGAGEERADTAATWWDESGVFFRRAVGGNAQLAFYDGMPRDVRAPITNLHEALSDQRRSRLYLAAERGRGTDIFWVEGPGFDGTPHALTRTPEVVEHSLALSADGQSVLCIGTSREGSELLVMGAQRGEGARSLSKEHLELLSLAPHPEEPGVVFVYARDHQGDQTGEHSLWEVTLQDQRWTRRLGGIYLPPGLAPSPALSHGGRYLYAVMANAPEGNPVVRFDRQTGSTTEIDLPTNGHQEVATADFEQAGSIVPWVAVVAVGDDRGQDVRNHLYIGPLGTWSGWSVSP